MPNTYQVLCAVAAVAREELDRLGHNNIDVRTNMNAWATYHKTYPLRPPHTSKELLSFGGKMVRVHLENNGRDQVHDEMDQFGWGRKHGQSPAVELAIVVLHEIAHVEASRAGARKRGSVHNHGFYSQLVPLVAMRADEVAYRIAELANSESLLDERKPKTKYEIRKANQEVAQQRPQVSCNRFVKGFKKGDRVYFVNKKGQTIIGKIARRGSKRWTVMTDTSKWYVPERMLHKIT